MRPRSGRARCRSTVVGHKALTLAPEDGLIQLAVHLAINHQFGQPFVRGLLDVALLARAQPVDWSTVVARARAWRVGTVVWTVLHLTADLLGLEEASPAITALTPSPLRRRLLSAVRQRGIAARRCGICATARHVSAYSYSWSTGGAMPSVYCGARSGRRHEWLALRYGAVTPAIRRRHLFAALRGRV